MGTIDEDFGWAGAGVVVGGKAHTVGSGVEEDDEVAGFDRGDDSVAGEKVTGFADWAYDVGGNRRLPCWLSDRDDLVVGVVERGADEIVHSSVSNDEGFGAVLFDDEDAGEECAGLSDDEAAGFEEEMGLLVGETFVNAAAYFSTCWSGWKLVVP